MAHSTTDGDESGDSGATSGRSIRPGRFRTRRAFVGGAVGASVVVLAGCTGGAGPGVDAGDEERPEGVSEEEFVSGPVPGPYRTATSRGGEQRDPDALQTKEDVQYQESAEAVDAGLITTGPTCGNCVHFIPDKNGDGFGACARVEGYIDAADWCTIWSPLEDGNG